MSTVFNDPNPIQEPQPAQENNNLQLADLQNLLMIVDVASQRGAFKGPELSQVGQVFDRVNKFLQSTVPANQQTQVPQPEVTQPTFTTPPTGSPVTSTTVPPFFPVGGNN